MSMQPFQDLSFEGAQALCHSFGSPLFLIDERILLTRLAEFQNALKRSVPNGVIAYSYKTNALRGLVSCLHEKGAWAEVVSEHEYNLACDLGIAGEQIVFNGPLKSDEVLSRAIAQNSKINVDHFEELARIAALAQSSGQAVPVGLRVHIEAHEQAWDRFGFSLQNGEFLEAARWVNQQPNLMLAGIHCHLGTNIRDLSRFAGLAQALGIAMEQVASVTDTSLQWLDVGGGLGGISPRWDEEGRTPFSPMPIQAYLDAMAGLFKKVGPETQVFFEPGRTLVDACGGLLCSVHGVRNRDENYASYIVDGGINVAPTVRVYRHPICALVPEGRDQQERRLSRLLGPSCMNHDVLSRDLDLALLERGDMVLMHGVGAYNMSRSVPFIHLRPGVVLWRGADKPPCSLKRAESFSENLRLETKAKA